MSLQDLGNLGEFIGAIAVVASVVYLALQIRQNTRSLNDSRHLAEVQSASQLMDSFNRILGQQFHSEYLRTVLTKAAADFDSLSSDDRYFFGQYFVQLLAHYYTAIRMHENGFLDDSGMRAFTRAIVRNLTSAGGKIFWEAYGPEMADFERIEELLARAKDHTPGPHISKIGDLFHGPTRGN